MPGSASRERVGAVGMIGAVAVLTPVVTGLIGVGGRIGGVLGAAMTTRGVLGAAMARGMPGAAMTLTIGGVPGTAMTTGGVPGTAMTIGGVPRQLCQQCWSQCQSDNN